MSTLQDRRRGRRTTVWLVTLATVAAGLSALAPSTDANADPIGDARARAAALTATVTRLETAAEVATERYDGIEARLGEAVTQRMVAERQLESDQGTQSQARDRVVSRVRALYESGGQATLLATVLEGSDPTDVMARLHTVGSLLRWDNSGVGAAAATTRRAADLAARLSAAATRVTTLQAAAAAAAGRVRGLLAAQQQTLADADENVRALVSAEQAAAAVADARSFADAVRAAGGDLSTLTTPPNQVATAAINAARSRLGAPYVWGASGPDTFDCSGLTQWSYAHAGVALPRVAADQWNAGPHVGLPDLQPGDLLFWATDTSDPATIHHVALYIGGGLMIAAPHTGDVVKVEPVYMDGYIGATRPFGGTP